MITLEKATGWIRCDGRSRRRRLAACEAMEPRKYLTVTWAPPVTYGTGIETPIEATHVYGSSQPLDLLVSGGSDFVVLTGQGNGTFLASNYPAAPGFAFASATPFVVGAFTEAGVPDVATFGIDNSSPPYDALAVYDYEQDTNHLYSTTAPYELGSTGTYDGNTGFVPVSAAVGNFISSSSLSDIAIVGEPEPGRELQLSIVVPDGSPGNPLFEIGNYYPLPNSNFASTSDEPIVVGDFGNGRQDIAVYDGSSGNLDVFMDNGADSFTALPPVPLQATRITTGVFTASGHTDIVAADGNTITLLKGNGDGTFAVQDPVTLPGAVTDLATADINLDGNLDVITDQGILLGNGDGTFQSGVVPMPISVTGGGNFTPTTLIATDITGDGKPDLIGVSSTNNLVTDVNTTLASVSVGLASSAATATPGTDVKFTATATSPFNETLTGPVRFFDGTTLLGSVMLTNGVATFDAGTMLSPGAHSITASYAGTTTFSAATSVPLTQSIVTPTNISLVGGAAQANAGDALTFTATVTGTDGDTDIPAGTVQFLDAGQSIGSAGLNAQGVATLVTDSLGVGSHTITAQYEGDSEFQPGTSTAIDQTIAQPPVEPVVTFKALTESIVIGRTTHVVTTVAITNTTAATIAGLFSGTVLVSNNGTILNATDLAVLPASRHSLRAGATLRLSATIKSLPAAITPGTYTLLAQISDPMGTLINTIGGPTFQAADAFVQLAAASSSVSAVRPVMIKPGKSGSFSILLANTGNIATTDAATINIGISTDGSTEAKMLEMENKPLKLQPGHSMVLHLHFVVPRGTSGGAYHPFVSISQDGSAVSGVGETQFSIA